MLRRELGMLYDPWLMPIRFSRAIIVFLRLIYICTSGTQNILSMLLVTAVLLGLFIHFTPREFIVPGPDRPNDRRGYS
jgi:hypothetical protein